MKVRIILSGAGGELDRQTIDIDNLHTHSDSAATEIGSAIANAIADFCWTLAPGDTIKIEEI